MDTNNISTPRPDRDEKRYGPEAMSRFVETSWVRYDLLDFENDCRRTGASADREVRS